MSKKIPQKANQPSQPARPAPTARPVAAKPVAAKAEKSPSQGLSQNMILGLVLAIISFAIYFNTIQNGYVLDDVIMVKDNVLVHQGFSGISELLATPHMHGYPPLSTVPNDTYRPLSLVMFAMEHGIFGGNPGPHHFFNIVVFIGCVLMFFSFLNKFFDGAKPIAAFAGALLFALHPVHTEVVANIKSRDELLCFFFAFMALNMFMDYMKNGKILKLLLGTFAMYLSFISKESVITFIGVVPVLYFLTKSGERSRAIMVTVGTFVATAIFLGVRKMILDKFNADTDHTIEFIDNALVEANFITRLATGILISGKYLWLLFIPYPLLCNYSYNAIPYGSFGDIKVLLSLAVYGGIIFVAIKRIIKDKKDPWAFAILFFLMTISLFTNLFVLIGAEMAERFMFMSTAGLGIVAALAADKWLIPAGAKIEALKTPKLAAVFGIVAVGFSGMVIARNSDWKDNVYLYKVDLEKSPNDCRLSYYLGTALAETVYDTEKDPVKKKEIDMESIKYLRQALLMRADFTEANTEMGRVYDREKMYDSAEVYDKKALKLNPNHVLANNNLGSVYLATGRYAQAVVNYRTAVAKDPTFHLAYFNLARTYGELKNNDSAIYFFKKTLETVPQSQEFAQEMLDCYQESGMAYYNKGDFANADVNFKQVLKMNPNDPNAVNNLGAIYLNGKNYPQAIEMFKKALALNPQYYNAYSNLGRAYYFTQQYDAALDMFNKELSINPKDGRDIPYMALSYKAKGDMTNALKYEAIAKTLFKDFKL